MGWLLGAAILGGAVKTKSANKAAKEAARIGEYQDQIDKYQNQQAASIAIENLIVDLSSLESTQQALNPAMGKRGTGGTAEARTAHQRGLLSRDIEDIERSVEMTGKMIDLQTQSRYVQTREQSKQRWLSWGASSLASLSTLKKK